MAVAQTWRRRGEGSRVFCGGMLILAVLLAEVTLSAPLSPGQPISLNFHQAPVHTVLHHLAEVSGLNLVVGPDVTGTVTLVLKDVPWEQALEVLLTRTGLTQERQGNLLVVKPGEPAGVHAARARTRVVPIHYRDATELGAVMQQHLGACASVAVDVRTNTLLITPVPSCRPLWE